MAVLYGTQTDGTLIPVQADSQGRLVAELAGVDQSVQGDLLVTGNVQMSSLNGGALGGFRNWVINGNFSVNQRGGDKRPPLGEYGFDRWKGVPGGLEQTIEALPAGRYTLSWTGGGMGSIGGITAPSAFVVDLPGGDTSLIVPDTADFVQLEPGEVHTPFEYRPLGVELALCHRYYQEFGNGVIFGVSTNNSVAKGSIVLPVEMRVAPNVTQLETACYLLGLTGDDVNTTNNLMTQAVTSPKSIVRVTIADFGTRPAIEETYVLHTANKFAAEAEF